MKAPQLVPRNMSGEVQVVTCNYTRTYQNLMGQMDNEISVPSHTIMNRIMKSTKWAPSHWCSPHVNSLVWAAR